MEKKKKVKLYLRGPINVMKSKSFLFGTPTCQYNMGKKLLFLNVVDCFSAFLFVYGQL